jgi:hypothetical protein
MILCQIDLADIDRDVSGAPLDPVEVIKGCQRAGHLLKERDNEL